MNNLFIVWNDSDYLGVPIIDEQHRGIVSTINSLHFLLRTKHAKSTLQAVVNTMREYTRIHFATEEMILEMIGYDQIEAHRELHAKLIMKSNSVAYESKLLNDPQQYLQFLKDWWLTHIRQQDKLYAPYAHRYMAARS